MADLFSYKCIACGGDVRFNPATGDYKCEYCGSRFTEADLEKYYREHGGAEEEQKAEEKEPEPEQRKDESGSTVLVYSCPSCGAEIMTEESTAATFCYYCHNPIILSGRLAGAKKPDYVVPFAIDRKKALDIFNKWIAQKKFVPKAFYNKDQIEKFSGVYFPYLLYSCKVTGHVDARGTKVNTVRVGNFEDVTTGTYHVRRDGDMPVENIPKNALKKANRVLVEGVQPFDTKEMKPFKMSYLSGFLAETKDMEANELQPAVSDEVRQYAVSQLTSSIAGYNDIQVTNDALQISDENWKYALMPVWTVTYKAPGSDKMYYLSMNGQSGKVIGELPVDKQELMKYFFTIFIPVFVVLLAISYFLL